jgi:hypothetical protein
MTAVTNFWAYLLRALFDKSWTEALRALEDAVKRGQEHQQALRELFRSIPKEAEITTEERDAFTKNRASIESAIKRLGVCVGELLKGLEARTANCPPSGRRPDFSTVESGESDRATGDFDRVAVPHVGHPPNNGARSRHRVGCRTAPGIAALEDRRH